MPSSGGGLIRVTFKNHSSQCSFFTIYNLHNCKETKMTAGVFKAGMGPEPLKMHRNAKYVGVAIL